MENGQPVDAVRAAIENNSTVTSTAGAVNVRAVATWKVHADGAGVAVAAKFGKPTNAAVSAAVGIGVAINEIFTAESDGVITDNGVRALILASTRQRRDRRHRRGRPTRAPSRR